MKLLVTFHSFSCLAWNIENNDARVALEMSSFNLEYFVFCVEELIKTITLILFGNHYPRPDFDGDESAIVTQDAKVISQEGISR